MLKYQKRIIDNSIELMGKAHCEIYAQVTEGRTDETAELLQLCQEFMIKIGETIEKSEGEAFPVIHDLEMYCELAYLVNQNIGQTEQCLKHFRRLANMFEKIILQVQKIKVKTEIVFFPYNAAMWDSLESIWLAAAKDPEVEAYVIPIPYYEKDKQGQVVTEKYDINKFPPYVPVVDYHTYNLEERQPDIAYIHNPYDRFNIVTSVHPDYYSYELKKNIAKVVYVPYFVTYDAVSVTHRELPSYYYVDYIVIQKEKMIDSFAPGIKREKFLPVGNPIADRIINLDKNRPDIPESWKPMLQNGRDFGGKKVVMYNTSLSLMIKERENFLDKIEYVLNIFRQTKDVIPVWRPHPLMHSTLQTMGDEYYQRFLNMEKRFLTERIGILDRTPDVGIAVALCDAYVGEDASSIIHMFGIAGKPRFYINLQIYKEADSEEECKVTSFGSYSDNDEEYFVAEEYRCICRKNKLSGEAEVLAHIPGTKLYPYCAYRDIYKRGDNLYLQPYSGEGLCIYNLKEASFRKIYMKDSVAYGFKRMLQDRNSLYLIPERYPYIVRFDMDTEEVEYYTPDSISVKAIIGAIGDFIDKTEEAVYLLPRKTVHQIKVQELLERTSGFIVFESEKDSLQDFLYSIAAEGMYDKEQSRSRYINVIETLDGTCGEKIHRIMMNNLKLNEA